MAGGLAHQLRNSIGAIVGYATLVAKRMRRAELDTQPIESLADETREAERLIERFLSFTRPFKSELQVIQLRDVVSDSVQTIEVQQELQHISVRTNLELNQPVQADPLLLKQTLINLIENAANAYGGKRGEVRIGLTRHDTYAEITVADDGCGISPDQQEKIFTPFYSSRPGGTGLGLPLAARIIDMHGGQMHLDTEPGRGTTFIIRLPLASSADSFTSAPGDGSGCSSPRPA
jgi:signal transduction histidine kinase